jgi:serine/threonine-protein kinase RsbW
VHYTLAFLADEHATRHAHQECDLLLHKNGVSEKTRAAARIVVAEALNNIVEHAYAGQGGKQIDLHLQILQKTVRFRITDTGAPLPGEILPPGAFPAISCGADNLPEGGFGWPLIHALTDKLSYQRKDSENILQFHISR